MDPIGHHYIVEASGCNPEIIGKVETVEQILVRAAEVAQVTVWSISFHRFNPNGVSGVVVISESHLSVHTWPEYGYVALDIFTCGNDAKPEAAVEHALKEFKARTMHITEVTRGLEEGDRQYFHSIVTWEETLPTKDDKRRSKAAKRPKRPSRPAFRAR
ncbi:MAG: adenosylmethionine decarboxylase [Armatimonadetes bacterium]|nr:adenosylmethionine decarboxylase [Armatimonadota bacterium]